MLHEGPRYNIRMLHVFHTYDKHGATTSRGNVLILDKETGKMYQRTGIGHDFGNFHPVYIRVGRAGKKSISLEKLLDSTESLFPKRETKFFNPHITRAILTNDKVEE